MKRRRTDRDSDKFEQIGGSGSSLLSVDKSDPAPPTLQSQPTHVSGEANRVVSLPPVDAAESEPPSKKRRLEDADIGMGSLAELVLIYDSAAASEDAEELHRRVAAISPASRVVTKYLKRSRRVASCIGPWPAELVWRHAIEDGSHFLRAAEQEMGLGALKDLTQLIRDWEFHEPDLVPSSQGFNVTPKFQRLVEILKASRSEAFRGIIIVKRKAVALAIAEAIPMLGRHLSFVRPSTLETLDKFASGTYNLLILTPSATELDIPKATTVIRFDLLEGDLAYGLSVDLVGGSESHLIHMLEHGNDKHRRILLESSTRLREMSAWYQTLHSAAVGTASPFPLLSASDAEQSESEDDEELAPYIQDPVTGGRIYPSDAVSVVYQVATAAGITHPTPLFQSKPDASLQYTCTVVLPGIPILSSSQSHPSMAHARREACYQFCVKMFEAAVLDSEFFLAHPIPREAHPAERSDDRTGLYPIKAPDFWAAPASLSLWYPTAIVPVELPRHAPILLITRHPLPKLPRFRLFISGPPAAVETVKCAPLGLDAEKINELYLYTLRVLRALMNKGLACALEDMPYLLAPLHNPPIADHKRWQPPDISGSIPWELVSLAAAAWSVPLKYGNAEVVGNDVADAIIQDRSTELTRRYEIRQVRGDLSPHSSPEDGPKATLLEFCKSSRKEFAGLKDENQAIIEVDSVVSGMSYLSPVPAAVPADNYPHYLIPELCHKFTVPASTFRTMLLFPSISKLIDGFLLTKELNSRFFRCKLSDSLLHTAVTAPSVRLEYDYDRLEFLGDSFLKLLASVHAYVFANSAKEGGLHLTRQSLVSNHALNEHFASAGLVPYIQSLPFAFKAWLPPHFHISGQTPKKVTGRRLGDKVIADVSEAILGAAFLSGGNDAGIMAAQAMNILPLDVAQWSDFGRKVLVPPSTISAKISRDTIQAIEGIVNHKFRYPYLLAQALTHGSISGPGRVSSERLEFLGDAVLDFLVTRLLFDRHPTLGPGSLTVLKAAMVSNSTLAAIAVTCGLSNHLLLADPLADSTTRYINQLKQKEAEEYELAAQEKRQPGQYWAFSDVIESILGAVYISDDFSSEGVEAFFAAVLKPFYDKHITLNTLPKHPMETLADIVRAQKCLDLEMRVPAEGQCEIMIHSVVLGSGSAGRTSVATRNACCEAISALEKDPDYIRRVCNCLRQADTKEARRKLDELLATVVRGKQS
ncbi:unnamed protein product [Mycena citricolor]|uniref:RNase III domain-containing protein n=1 Tax=Mycena citricolor TaxID=2018698 RepID=A0AAD2HIL4_9AGAR|nr:unnamed protein product [Mycena citricolor]